MRNVFLVLARSHESYQDFLCNQPDLNPADFYYVGKRSQLYGIVTDRVGGILYWEGWEGNPQYNREFRLELDHLLKRWKFENDRRTRLFKRQNKSKLLDALRDKGLRVIRF